MSKYQERYKFVEQNRDYFHEILKIVKCKFFPLWLRKMYANYALKIASYSPTGYFYSNVLEKFFVDIGKKYNTKLPNEYKPKTVLHVLTTAYKIGGHTRVVERWIDNTKDLYRNSVVILNQKKDAIPQLLIDNTKKSDGQFIVFGKRMTNIQRALKLRKLASEYEFIVLHTHMHDPIATIAFGTENFTRPVLFFNHADHLFWIGKTVSDELLDLRTHKSISKEYRRFENPKFCPIPCDFSNKMSISREEARNALNLDLNKKYILTSGGAFKFTPICNDGIFESLDKILTLNQEVNLVAVGPDGTDWRNLKSKFGSRMTTISGMPYEDYLRYVASADLVIDSYPMNGETTLVDAMNAKKPFVSLDTLCAGQSDFVMQSEGYCKTKEELVEKVSRILNDDEYRKQILNSELAEFDKECLIENWVNKVTEIYKNAPKTHKLREIENEYAPCFIDDYSAVIERLYNPEEKPLKKRKDVVFLAKLLKD